MATRSGAAARVQQEPQRRGLAPAWVESPRSRGGARTSRLSGKERAVLGELARGLSTEETAHALSVSPHTVRTHIKNGLRKLGARTRAHAVAIALSEGVIDYDPNS